MPLNIDWGNNIIQITSPDIQVSGQVLHDFIEDQMAAPEGLLYNDILNPEGKIEDPTNPGIFSQIILILSSVWQIQFWPGSGYTKIFGAKIVGGVSDQPMKATGAAGDITVMESPVDGLTVVSGSGVTEQDKIDIKDKIWQDPGLYAEGTKGHALQHVEYVEHTVFIDTELITDGNGTELSPFNNILSAFNFAELHGFRRFGVLSEVTFGRLTIKNYDIYGVGTVPIVNTNAQFIENSSFFQITMVGFYTGSIIARDCCIKNGSIPITTINGFFDNCAFSDNLQVPDGGVASIFNSSALAIEDNAKPVFDIGTVFGTAQLELMRYVGGCTIINCTQPTDNVKIISTGIVEIDSSCTDGEIIILGNVKPIDNSNGANVQFFALNPDQLNALYEASYHKRKHDKIADTITIYEADKVTPKAVFDATDDLSEITPQ